MRTTLHMVPLDIASILHMATLDLRLAECRLFCSRNNIDIDFIKDTREELIDFVGSGKSSKEIESKIANIGNINELELLKLKNSIFSNKDDTEEILNYINVIFLNMALNETKNAITYSNCIQIIENTKNRLKRNGNYDMTIDNCLLSLWEEING